MKVINFILKGFNWFWAVMFLLFAIVSGVSVAAVVFLFGAIAVLPIEPIRNLWKMFPVKGFLVKPLAMSF